MNVTYALAAIAVMAVITLFTRAFPFLLFGGKRKPPKFVLYLGEVLPPAIIAMLVVYCLKDMSLISYPYGLPEIISGVAVAALHVWKRNNMLSIFGGTILYMVLVQVVFV